MRSLTFTLIALTAIACQSDRKKAATTQQSINKHENQGRLLKVDTPGISAKYRFTVRIDGEDHQFSSLLYLSQEEIAMLKDSIVNFTFKYHIFFNEVEKREDSVIDHMSMIYNEDSFTRTHPTLSK